VNPGCARPAPAALEVLAFARKRVYYPTNPTPPPIGFPILTRGTERIPLRDSYFLKHMAPEYRTVPSDFDAVIHGLHEVSLAERQLCPRHVLARNRRDFPGGDGELPVRPEQRPPSRFCIPQQLWQLNRRVAACPGSSRPPPHVFIFQRICRTMPRRSSASSADRFIRRIKRRIFSSTGAGARDLLSLSSWGFK